MFVTYLLDVLGAEARTHTLCGRCRANDASHVGKGTRLCDHTHWNSELNSETSFRTTDRGVSIVTYANSYYPSNADRRLLFS
jgi:hypothetical protein